MRLWVVALLASLVVAPLPAAAPQARGDDDVSLRAADASLPGAAIGPTDAVSVPLAPAARRLPALVALAAHGFLALHPAPPPTPAGARRIVRRLIYTRIADRSDDH